MRRRRVSSNLWAASLTGRVKVVAGLHSCANLGCEKVRLFITKAKEEIRCTFLHTIKTISAFTIMVPTETTTAICRH